MLCEIQISVGEELGVGRVIVLLVEIDQLLILEVGNEFGLTPRVEPILTLLEQVLVKFVHEGVIRT